MIYQEPIGLEVLREWIEGPRFPRDGVSTVPYRRTFLYWTKSLDGLLNRSNSFPPFEIADDGSSIMITVESDGTSNLNLWSFLEPFTTGVWVMIIVTIVVSALVYMFLDCK